jgi:hypothetical protein
MPYKANEARRHKIPRVRYQVTNWPAYDRALQQRGSLTVWVTPEALAAWHPPRTGQRGRPRDYSEVAIETGHLLRLAFGRPWRQTEGLLRSLTALLDCEHRRSRPYDIRAAQPWAGIGPDLGPGTSERTSPRRNRCHWPEGLWRGRMAGRETRRARQAELAELHLAVDPSTSEILASELTTNDEGDASQAGPLLEQISGPIGSVTRTAPMTASLFTAPSRSASPTARGGDYPATEHCDAGRGCRDHPQSA